MPSLTKLLRAKDVRRLASRYRVDDGSKFRLRDVDPDDTAGLDETAAGFALAACVARIAEVQKRLFAEDRRALLLVFQAMDAAGKDSTIANVLSGVNPAGCQVFAFKAPTTEDLDHDYLWRHARCLPERGRIGVFNRSWYEEMLIVRVHEEILANERIPEEPRGKELWDARFADVNAYERHLDNNGTRVLKFFLHVSKEEQRKRFLARIDEPSKNWKFSLADVKERERWDDYMEAYEKLVRHTGTKHAPWHVIPADHKWFTRLTVAATIVDALETIDPHFPEFDKAKRNELEEARRRLEAEGRKKS